MSGPLCAWCLSTPPRHERCQPVSRITMVDGRPAIVLVPCMCGCTEYAQDELW